MREKSILLQCRLPFPQFSGSYCILNCTSVLPPQTIPQSSKYPRNIGILISLWSNNNQAFEREKNVKCFFFTLQVNLM